VSIALRIALRRVGCRSILTAAIVPAEESPMRETNPPKPPRFPIWETLAVFLAIASLWPAYILRLEWGGWRILCYVMFAIMAIVAVRRIWAFHRFARDAEEARRKAAEQDKGERVRLPWEPPADDVVRNP